jgi:hypothetical protein
VAATTNNVNTTRLTQLASPPSTAARTPHIVTLSGGGQALGRTDARRAE